MPKSYGITWNNALQKYNYNKNAWCSPRRDTPEYLKVKDIFETMKEEAMKKAEKKPKPKPEKKPEPKKEKKIYVIETDKYYDYDFARSPTKYYKYKNKHYFVFNNPDDSIKFTRLHLRRGGYEFSPSLPAGLEEKLKKKEDTPKEKEKPKPKPPKPKPAKPKPEDKVEEIINDRYRSSMKYILNDLQNKLLTSYINFSQAYSAKNFRRGINPDFVVKIKKQTLNYFKKLSSNDKEKVKELKKQVENTGSNANDIKELIDNLKKKLREEIIKNPPQLKQKKEPEKKPKPKPEPEKKNYVVEWKNYIQNIMEKVEKIQGKEMTDERTLQDYYNQVSEQRRRMYGGATVLLI
jgi:hypothetical protein